MDGDHEITERQIETAIWYVKHKALLRQGGLVLALAVDVILGSYVLWNIGRDFIAGPSRTNQEIALSDTLPISGGKHPLDLELGGVEIVNDGAVMDLVARVHNPNLRWLARFEYVIGIGEKIETQAGFLLPGESRPFIYTLRGASSGLPIFRIGNLSWKQLRAQDIPDATAWISERMNFKVLKTEFTPAIIQGGGQSLSRAKVTIANKSGYGFIEPKFIILLYRGENLVGVQSAVLERFAPATERELEVSWVDHLGAVSNIEVVPEVDLFDGTVYLKP